MPIPEITYPCSLLLSPRRTLNQYQLHTTWPRSELTSPTPTGQSCSPIYKNYTIGIRRYQCLYHSFQAPRRWSLSLPPTLACLCIPRPSGVCGRVSVLHPSLGYRSPISRVPHTESAIRGIQHIEGPILLRLTRLPLTLAMLGQMLRRLEKASLKQHNCLMLRAALTLVFFSFLWVGKFTMKNRSFNPRFYPTMQDSSWSREGVCYFVKQPKNDQMGRGATIFIGRTHHAMYVSSGSSGGLHGILSCSASLHHSSTTGMGCHSQPMLSPSTFLHLIEQCGFDAAKFNTHSLRIGAASTAARAGLPSDTIQKLVR